MRNKKKTNCVLELITNWAIILYYCTQKILNNNDELIKESKEILGKKLITPQTGKEGKEVKRLYVEESSSIEKEFYLSCLVDRASSKIAFISSDQGGMDIEEVAQNKPDKIITTCLLYTSPSPRDS